MVKRNAGRPRSARDPRKSGTKGGRRLQALRVSVNPDGSLLTGSDGDFEEVAKDFRELTARLSLRGEQSNELIVPVVVGYSMKMRPPSVWPVVVGARGRLRRPLERQSFINALRTGAPYDGEFTDTTLVEVGRDVTEMSASDPAVQWVPAFLLLTPEGQLVDVGEAIPDPDARQSPNPQTHNTQHPDSQPGEATS